MNDVIDSLVGIAPGSHLDRIRAQRVQARDNAQLSYLALFRPATPGEMTQAERHAVAVFTASLHGQPEIAAFYAAGVADAAPLLAAARAAAAKGPYGHYPAGPLSGEDAPGPVLRPDALAAFDRKLAAGLAHAHLLVFHPRDAAPPALQALLDAGWSTTGIVTLSQLVAFLSFQIRVVVGLRALAAAPAA